MTESPPPTGQEAVIEAAHHHDEVLVRDLPVRLRELVSVAACIGAGIAILLGSRNIIVRGGAELGPTFWPVMLGWALIGFGIVIIANNVLRGVRAADIPDRMGLSGLKMFALTALIAVGYLLLWNVLQFWMITFVALIAFTFVLGGRGWRAALAFPAVVTAVLHFLFIVALRVPL